MNTDILIIGGDGDLALRKLYPAFYYLTLNKCMPDDVRIFGMARTPSEQDQFLFKVNKWLRGSVGVLYDESIWRCFCQSLTFVQGDSTKEADLKRFKENHLGEGGELIVYMAVRPMIFGKICTNLEACGMAGSTTRLVVEKPLGDSKESFLAINNELSRVFSERQLFRIDHYLGKETVLNLLALRFGNDVFEPLWNSKHIDFIQITASETVGCGNRWDFYDQTGALRDMVQNHLLQVLSLVCMEPPISLDADFVRTEKLKVLRCLKHMNRDDVQKNTVRGQYGRGVIAGEQVSSYLEEGTPSAIHGRTGKGGSVGERTVNQKDDGNSEVESNTETYVAIKVEVDNWRWSGTPIYLKTGKHLDQRHAEIVVQFKPSHTNVFVEQQESDCCNQLVINLQPNEGISLKVKNMKAGLGGRFPIENRSMDLSFPESMPTKKHDAYTRLLFDVIRNDQTLFISEQEVEAAWEWVDAIRAGWEGTPPFIYESGSMGPVEAERLWSKEDKSD